MVRLHHVNLGIYEDGLDAQKDFLVGILGMRVVDPGPDLVGRANWFEDDTGTQVHLSKDPDHRPAKPADYLRRGIIMVSLGIGLAIGFVVLTSPSFRGDGPPQNSPLP